MKQRGSWKIKSSKEIYDNAWINVTEHSVINPGNAEGIYGEIHFKNIAIGIIPLDEEYNTWIVGQHRFPIDLYSWEIIEGGGQIGVDPIESAKRELAEEAGIVAENYELILRMHLSNSVSDEYGLIYIAKGLSFQESSPEIDEELVIKKVPFNQLYQSVMNGDMTDSLTVAGVLKTKILIDQGVI
ncbi:NUDIX hydrolase [bacterium]|nr:NUDIX hydrolase [bacterium]